MDLNTAITILALNVKEAGKKMPTGALEALKLGIEALKAIQKLRDYEHHVYPTDLPGETKEGE